VVAAATQMALALRNRREGGWLAEQVERVLRDPALPVLEPLLSARDRSTRRAAYRASIATIRLDVDRLTAAAAKDPDVPIRIMSAQALIAISADPSRVRRLLTSRTALVRAEALRAMAAAAPEAAIAAVTDRHRLEGVAIPSVSTDYDPTSGAVTVTRSGGATITRDYDLLGRVLTYTDTDGAITRNEFDRYGKPSKVSDNTGTTTFGYDRVAEPRGLLTSVTDSIAGTFTARYSPDGQLVEAKYPGGMTRTDTLDASFAPVARVYKRDSDKQVAGGDVGDGGDDAGDGADRAGDHGGVGGDLRDGFEGFLDAAPAPFAVEVGAVDRVAGAVVVGVGVEGVLSHPYTYGAEVWRNRLELVRQARRQRQQEEGKELDLVEKVGQP
jgi:YD repeat-containing protein